MATLGIQSTRAQVRRRIRHLIGDSDLDKGRRINAITSTAGTANGTTLVASSLPGVDAGLIGAYIRMFEGDSQGEERKITAYVSSTGTVTVAPGFSSQIGNTSKFALFERGKYSDIDIEDALSEAQIKIAKILPNEVKWFLRSSVSEIDVKGGSMQILSEEKLSDIMDFDQITSTEETVIFRLLDYSQLQNVQHSRHPDFATTDRPVAMMEGRDVMRIFPSDIATVNMSVFKVPSYINLSDSTDTNNLDIVEPWIGDVSLYASYLLTGEDRFLGPLSLQIKRGFGFGEQGFQNTKSLKEPETEN